MTNPIFSIVTVTLNNGSGLEKTLDSIISQNFFEYEIIVIDGESSDNTKEIIEKRIGHVAYYCSEKDYGIYDAMNKGLSKTTGTWVNFLNSGDIYASSNVLNDIYSRICDNSNASIIYSDLFQQYFRKNGKKEFKHIILDHNKRLINHQAVFYKRKLHDKTGNYISINGFYLADYLFFHNLFFLNLDFVKTENIIAVSDPTGISSKRENYQNRLLLDVIILKKSFILTCIKVAAHAILYNLKKIF